MVVMLREWVVMVGEVVDHSDVGIAQRWCDR